MKVAQWCVIANLVFALIVNLNWDFNGRPARKATGWGGAAISLWLITGYALVYWLAGAFSEVVK